MSPKQKALAMAEKLGVEIDDTGFGINLDAPGGAIFESTRLPFCHIAYETGEKRHVGPAIIRELESGLLDA